MTKTEEFDVAEFHTQTIVDVEKVLEIMRELVAGGTGEGAKYITDEKLDEITQYLQKLKRYIR